MKNVMKTFQKHAILGALLVALVTVLVGAVVVGSLFAQQGNVNQSPTFTDTTLTAALTSTALVMNVASSTGFTANTTMAKIDDEFISISVVAPGTIGVRRGQFGTRATKHGNGSRVRVGANANFSACGGVTNGFTPCGDGYNSGTVTHFSSSLFFPQTVVTTLTTAGALTYTPGQVLGGMILRDPNGSARTDTLPTAALLAAAIPGATIGTTFDFFLRNDADASETITIAAGTGGTTTGGGTMTVAQNNAKFFRIRFTAVAVGSEAYTVYSLGAVTF